MLSVPDITRKSFIRGALRRLQLSRGSLIGAVLTGYDAKAAGYGYGADYGYGYGYGAEASPRGLSISHAHAQTAAATAHRCT